MHVELRIGYEAENMPRHKEGTYAFTMNVVSNKRPDGRYQYKITLPKALGDMTLGIKGSIIGEFELSEIGYGKNDPSLVFSLYRFENNDVSIQKQLYATKWTDLICPFCNKKAAPLIFNEWNDPISQKGKHACGAMYYADRSDTRRAKDWESIRKRVGGEWEIIHNYHIELGKVGSNLDFDFDINHGKTRMVHVIFLKPESSRDGAPEDIISDLFS
jgi:hypothetical protein